MVDLHLLQNQTLICADGFHLLLAFHWSKSTSHDAGIK